MKVTFRDGRRLPDIRKQLLEYCEARRLDAEVAEKEALRNWLDAAHASPPGLYLSVELPPHLFGPLTDFLRSHGLDTE